MQVSPPGQPARPRRTEPREVFELRKLKELHPELVSAVDMQLALLDLQRRVQARVPIPTRRIDDTVLRRHAAEHTRLLSFSDIPIEWTDVRLMVRETADILRRFDSLEDASHAEFQALALAPHEFRDVIEHWYALKAADRGEAADGELPGVVAQVLTLAMRPFLTRCAETVLPLLDLSLWDAPHCPLCGGEPELAAITPAADRLLLCGRCTGAWRFDPIGCPFCGNRDRLRITSFTSRDGLYRLFACDLCLRYLKAFDGRRATRSVLLAVDTIATLPLDAAALQKGYQS